MSRFSQHTADFSLLHADKDISGGPKPVLRHIGPA